MSKLDTVASLLKSFSYGSLVSRLTQVEAAFGKLKKDFMVFGVFNDEDLVI